MQFSQNWQTGWVMALRLSTRQYVQKGNKSIMPSLECTICNGHSCSFRDRNFLVFFYICIDVTWFVSELNEIEYQIKRWPQSDFKFEKKTSKIANKTYITHAWLHPCTKQISTNMNQKSSIKIEWFSYFFHSEGQKRSSSSVFSSLS